MGGAPGRMWGHSAESEEWCLESHATSDVCQQQPVSAREIAQFRPHVGQPIRTMVWGQMSGRKKNGAESWKVLQWHFLILRNELCQVAACHHPALHYMTQGVPSALCCHEQQEESKTAAESVPLTIHLGWLIAAFSQADAMLLFSLTLFSLHTSTQSFQEEKYYLLVCSRTVLRILGAETGNLTGI